MHEESIQLDQVVWAKIRGYPWWPAIVSSKQVTDIEGTKSEDSSYRITVKFIGENSQYILFSAALTQSKVADFITNYEKFSTSKRKVGNIQWLAKSIKVAKRLADGEILLADVEKMNTRLVKSNKKDVEKPIQSPHTFPSKLQPDKNLPSSNQDVISELKNRIAILSEILQEKLRSKPGTMTGNESRNLIMKHKKVLRTFTRLHGNLRASNSNLSVVGVLESFDFLCNLNVSANLISSCKLLRVVKMFCDEFDNCPYENLRRVAELAEQLLAYWKSLCSSDTFDRPTKVKEPAPEPVVSARKLSMQSECSESSTLPENSVINKLLRKKVCQKIATELERNKFEKSKAREIALCIEKKLRKRDPTMLSIYKSLFKQMIQDIRFLTPQIYERLTPQ